MNATATVVVPRHNRHRRLASRRKMASLRICRQRRRQRRAR